MSKVLGVIPARWASTRFPGKPLHLISGKPLLQHVWERCEKANRLDALIIATDDARIVEAAAAWGAQVKLTSAKHASGTDRIAEIAEKNKSFTHIINIQGDEPLIDPKLIDRLVTQLVKEKDLEMITAANPFADFRRAQSPHQVKVILSEKGDALYFSRALLPFPRNPSPPIVYMRHNGIYGYTRALLLRFVRWKISPLEQAESLEQLRALENGVRIRVVITESGSPGIDTPEDARLLELEGVLEPRRTVDQKKPADA